MTYPHTDVVAELQHWEKLHVDVTDHPEVAELFGVRAMPTALAVRADGVVLGRKLNYVGPSEFLAWLREMREAD